MNLKAKTVLAALSLTVLAVGGCGSDSLSGSTPSAAAPSGSDSPAAASTVDAELAAKLPAAIKEAGVITVGTDASYAPNEFLDGNTVVGMDVDLFTAVAAKLGVKADFQPSSFSTIIVGVNGGKYDVGVSSFTINADRLKQVNMVSYFSAGTQWATADGNPKGVDPADACGKTVAVQIGTVQQTDDLPARQAKCGSDKIKILPFEKQDQVNAALASGRADAMLADSPITAYAVQQAKGKLATAGEVYDAAPYGIVVPKKESDFAEVIADALDEIKDDGTYAAALKKWGVDKGAVDDFDVNP